MIGKHPLVALVTGVISMIPACFGAFYSILVVGVSDGPGHITAQLMLAGCLLTLLAALFVVGRSTRALLVRL